jgi:hypothetical protein
MYRHPIPSRLSYVLHDIRVSYNTALAFRESANVVLFRGVPANASDRPLRTQDLLRNSSRTSQCKMIKFRIVFASVAELHLPGSGTPSCRMQFSNHRSISAVEDLRLPEGYAARISITVHMLIMHIVTMHKSHNASTFQDPDVVPN